MATSTEHRANTQLPTSPPVLVIGAGGHAKVVIELVRAAGAYEIIGLIDLNLSGASDIGRAYLGNRRRSPTITT